MTTVSPKYKNNVQYLLLEKYILSVVGTITREVYTMPIRFYNNIIQDYYIQQTSSIMKKKSTLNKTHTRKGKQTKWGRIFKYSFIIWLITLVSSVLIFSVFIN